MKVLSILILGLVISIPFTNGNAGEFADFNIDTDEPRRMLFGFFDLRDRETSIQVTNSDESNRTLHIQVFNVDQDCNENNFFDVFTPNDTHVYEMRNIISNDGNPSGVVLPENAYGIIVISAVEGVGQGFLSGVNIFGNQRILDSAGYEYRTNLVARSGGDGLEIVDETITFNYSSNNGIIFSESLVFPIIIKSCRFK